jgi:hypothetical protein
VLGSSRNALSHAAHSKALYDASCRSDGRSRHGGQRRADRACSANGAAAVVGAQSAVHTERDRLLRRARIEETYALLLLGFAVAFVIAAHARTASLLAGEGDHAARAGARAIARAEWFLARADRR